MWIVKDATVFLAIWAALFLVGFLPACFVFWAFPSGDLAWSLVRLWAVLSCALVVGVMVDDARK